MTVPNKVVGKILGHAHTDKWSHNMAKGECQVCGAVGTVYPHQVALWDFGVRNVKLRNMCPSCIKAEEKGEL
jgi:hypothetical protein